MRFICDKCHAKYSIADHKVQKKVLKIRCKKCSNVIIVRDPSSQKTPSNASLTTRTTTRNRLKPLPSKPSFVNGVQQRSSLQTKATSPRSSVVPTQPTPLQRKAQEVANPQSKHQTFSEIETIQTGNAGESTVIARISADWLKQIREETHEEPIWFAAVQGQPIGPIVRSEIISYIRNGEIAPRGLVWRAGWGDWVPAYDVNELKDAFRNTPPPPSNRTKQQNKPLEGFHVSKPFQAKLNTSESRAFEAEFPKEEATVIQSIASIMAQAPQQNVSQESSSSKNYALHANSSFDIVEPATSFDSDLTNDTDITGENEIIQNNFIAEPAPKKNERPFPFDTKPKPSPFDTKPKPSPFDTKPKPSPFDTKPKPSPFDTKPKPSPFDTKPKPSPFDFASSQPIPSSTFSEPEVAQKMEAKLPLKTPQPFSSDFPTSELEQEQDSAILEKVLPEKLDDSTLPPVAESSEEELFFTSDVGFAKSNSEGVFELTLPPIPDFQEEEEIEEIDMNDPDIIEIKDTITEKWTSRFALLAILLGILLLALPLLLKKDLLIGKLDQKNDLSKYKLTTRSGITRKLTKAELEAQRLLLEGKLSKIKKIRRYRRYRRYKAKKVGNNITIRSLTPSGSRRRISLLEKIQREAHCKALRRLGKPCKGDKQSSHSQSNIPSGLSKAMYNRLVKIVLKHQGKVKYCYEKYLRGVLVSGQLLMELKIKQSGRVLNVRTLTRRFRGKKITRCIKRNMKHWRFPAFSSDEPIRLQVPYKLKAIY